MYRKLILSIIATFILTPSIHSQSSVFYDGVSLSDDELYKNSEPISFYFTDNIVEESLYGNIKLFRADGTEHQIELNYSEKGLLRRARVDITPQGDLDYNSFYFIEINKDEVISKENEIVLDDEDIFTIIDEKYYYQLLVEYSNDFQEKVDVVINNLIDRMLEKSTIYNKTSNIIDIIDQYKLDQKYIHLKDLVLGEGFNKGFIREVNKQDVYLEGNRYIVKELVFYNDLEEEKFREVFFDSNGDLVTDVKTNIKLYVAFYSNQRIDVSLAKEDIEALELINYLQHINNLLVTVRTGSVKAFFSLPGQQKSAFVEGVIENLFMDLPFILENAFLYLENKRIRNQLQNAIDYNNSHDITNTYEYGSYEFYVRGILWPETYTFVNLTDDVWSERGDLENQINQVLNQSIDAIRSNVENLSSIELSNMYYIIEEIVNTIEFLDSLLENYEAYNLFVDSRNKELSNITNGLIGEGNEVGQFDVGIITSIYAELYKMITSDIVFNFQADKIEGIAPLAVQFTFDGDNSELYEYGWDLTGNGIIDSYEQNPSYIYDAPGTYSVSLTVSDGTQEVTETKVDFISVTEEETVNPDLTIYFDEGPYIKNDAISVRVKTEPATEGLKFDFSVSPNNGSLQVFNSGYTNSFGIANAEFIPVSGGEYLIEATNSTLGKVSKSVSVADEIPPTFSPSFVSGNEIQSEYSLYFKYQGFSWTNDPFTIRTDNGFFKSSGTQEYSGTMSRQTSLSTNIVINEPVNTTIWLEHGGNVYQYSFIPQIITNEEISSFKNFTYNILNDFDWSAVDNTILIGNDRNILKVDNYLWEDIENKQVARYEIEALSTNKNGSMLVYVDDDRIHKADPILLENLGVQSSEFWFTEYAVLDWSYDDTKIIAVDWETHVLLNTGNLSTSRNLTDENIYEVDVSFRNNSSHYAVSIDNLDVKDVSIYNTSGSVVKSLLASEFATGTGVSYSPDGNYLAVTSDYGSITIFDATNNYSQVTSIIDDFSRLKRVRWNPNSEYNVLAVLTENRVYFYDVESSSRMFKTEIIGSTDSRSKIKWSKDGNLLGVLVDGNLNLFSPFDQIPPTITANLPSVVKSETIEFKGSALDASEFVLLNIYVNDELVHKLLLDENPEFSTLLDLDVGNNIVKIVGTDRYLNTTELVYNVQRVITHFVSGSVLLDSIPLENVLVSLIGNAEETKLTDADGNFMFQVIDNETVAVDFSKEGFKFYPKQISLEEINSDTSFTVLASSVISYIGEIPDIQVHASDNRNQEAEKRTIQNVSSLFEGGTPPISYEVYSSDPAVARGELINNEIEITANGTSIDSETALLTISAIDDSGQQAAVSFNVTVVPAFGDLNADGRVNSFDATRILQYNVGSYNFNELQQDIADIDQNEILNAADASLILQYAVELINQIPTSDLPAMMSSSSAEGNIANANPVFWGETQQDGQTLLLPVILNSSSPIYSIDLNGRFDAVEGMLKEISFPDLPDGWFTAHRIDEEGGIHLSMAGTEPYDGSQIAILRFNLNEFSQQLGVEATGYLNNSSFTLNQVSVQEAVDQFALENNFPNPFNPSTTVRYQLPATSDVRIEMFNIAGQRVMQLVDESQNAGSYNINVDMSAFSSGVYFIRFMASSEQETYIRTSKMTLIK